MVVACALVGVAMWKVLSPPEAIDARAATKMAAQEILGQAVSLSVEYEQRADTWVLMCGKVLAPDGTTFEAQSESTVLQLQDSADYCALIDSSEGMTVRELDIGSTDMPAMDWMEQYALPPELLQGS